MPYKHTKDCPTVFLPHKLFDDIDVLNIKHFKWKEENYLLVLTSYSPYDGNLKSTVGSSGITEELKFSSLSDLYVWRGTFVHLKVR